MGDFNINLLNSDTYPLTENFINTLSSHFISPQIIQPTRIIDHTATLIDNIFLSSTEHYSISGNIIHDITDHLPNFLVINKLSSAPNKLKIFKRDYSNFDEHHRIRDVQLINWQELLVPNNNVNQMFDSFYTCLSNIIDKHAPLKKLSKREVKMTRKAWITPGIKNSIANKNKLFQTYLRNRCEFNHSQFKRFRNKLKHIINVSIKHYYRKYFAGN